MRQQAMRDGFLYSHEEKKAIPYVMENIELLFAAYFNLPEQADFRNNALKMFYFVRGQEAQIHKMLEE